MNYVVDYQRGGRGWGVYVLHTLGCVRIWIADFPTKQEAEAWIANPAPQLTVTQCNNGD